MRDKLKNNKKLVSIVGGILLVCVLAFAGFQMIASRGHEYSGAVYTEAIGESSNEVMLSSDSKHAVQVIKIADGKYKLRSYWDIELTSKNDKLSGKSARYSLALMYKTSRDFKANKPYAYSYGKDPSKGIQYDLSKQENGLTVKSKGISKLKDSFEGSTFTEQYSLKSENTKFKDTKALLDEVKSAGIKKRASTN